MKEAQFIADLFEIRKGLITPSRLDMPIQPNVTYSVVETLIAVFMDKYNVDYDDVRKILNERELLKTNTPH